MSKYAINEATSTGIADSIRTITGKTGPIPGSSMKYELDRNIEETTGIVSEQREIINQIKEALKGKMAPSSGSESEDKLIDGTIVEYTNSTVSNIRTDMFYGLTDLARVSFTACTNIGSYAFYSCTNLTTANFPVCKSIGSGAFSNCSNLTNISFPACSYIGNSAFYDCTNLTSVSFPACTEIDSYAFASCYSLTTADFPVCTSIRTSAFARCSSLATVNIPACKSLASNAFQSCSSLTSINLPMCSYINSSAFLSCRNLTNLTLGSTSVATLGNINAFTNTPMSNSTYTGSFGSIYVLASLVNAYKSATNWVTYADRITSIPGS